MALDVVDRQIIGSLKLDGRMSYAEIASRLGVSEGTVRNRLTRLVESGALRIMPVVEPDKIGYRLNVWLGIHCHPGSLSEVARDLRELPEVRYVAICTGTYDVICECVFLSEAELLGFLTETTRKVDGIAEINTSTVLEISKFGYEWELREEDARPRRRHRSGRVGRATGPPT